MIRETHTLALWRSLDIASRARRINPATIAQAERSFRKGLSAGEAATVLAVSPIKTKVADRD